MKKDIIHIGSVELPLQDFVVARTGILGITKSGKSYGAKGIAEQLLDHGVPFIVFDAIGIWHWIRTARPGGKGYKVVVAGGKKPDLPLTPESAPTIVRAAINENIPLIIDLYDPKLSKADWHKIVQKSFGILLHENVGLRHIFLEESGEYVPQTIYDKNTYSAVEKVARMGGNASLGITFINPRAQEINKAVLELCDNLILFRQRGSHAITALQKWLDRVSKEISSEIAKSLPQMSPGECWVWAEDSDMPVRTKTHLINSFHPDRRKPELTLAVSKEVCQVSTAEFVTRLSSQLEKVIKEATENDPPVLKRKIQELERKLANAQLPMDAPLPEPVPFITAQQESLLHGIGGRFFNIEQQLRQQGEISTEISKLLKETGDVKKEIMEKFPKPKAHPYSVAGTRTGRLPSTDKPNLTSLPKRQPVKNNEWAASQEFKPSKCQKALLAVLAKNYEQGCAIDKLALHAGYRQGGTLRNELAALRSNELITGPNTGIMHITTLGMTWKDYFPVVLSGDELIDFWKKVAGFGKAHRELIEALRRTSAGYDMASLCAATESQYQPGGTMRNILSEMRSSGVIVGKNTDIMTLNPLFFE